MKRRRIRFADAVAVLEDEFALTVRDPFSQQEERWITLGKDAFGVLLIVVSELLLRAVASFVSLGKLGTC